ncbi:ribonuclease III [Prochlorococcus marinus]|uniref:Ribonuclease 3 n=1 Tax=Prochlorococcus marinus (strain MIT 9211) TaxID=93059 RepID=A9BD45_PROM4|nr:ribonuclease III [Prochlorococcus marinus]ABX09658.1 putative ribonuclease III [Prochlorococcus marinus str. MIT 9211]
MTHSKKTIISKERIQQIYNLLDKIVVNKSNLEFIKKSKSYCLNIFNEALTHTSTNSKTNHERLEFLGDAVLRLAASEYIEENFPNLKVGDRSALRAQLVSDEWLTKVGQEINIKQFMLIGPKAHKDKAASATLQAEATEAMIGALYECLKDIKSIKVWLKPYWDKTSKSVLEDPHRLNSKSALQEWSQGNGLDIPIYKNEELSQKHGDPRRFFCKVLINKKILGEGWGSSRKQAEKEAALKALNKLENP